ncbi:MAG: hypothetical protein NTZ39_07680 [Methanoregula sp.]|nr:hypothetical protein [Methanoregula sp.]
MPWLIAARSVTGFKKGGYWGLFQLTGSRHGTTIIKHSYPYHQLLAHLTKFTGIPQMLAMKRGVSTGDHAYDNKRIIGCATTVRRDYYAGYLNWRMPVKSIK